jgi:hypothetical protein
MKITKKIQLYNSLSNFLYKKSFTELTIKQKRFVKKEVKQMKKLNKSYMRKH